MYLPDFTLMIRGEEYYWEHLGMLDKPEYEAHWEEKKAWYEKYSPGRLVTTCECETLSGDADEIINELMQR